MKVPEQQNEQAALPAALSIVIPTFKRERVLIETLEHLLRLPNPAHEILVIDQTLTHAPATAEQLELLNAAGQIRWIFHQPPSIPAAMNRGALEAGGELLLFLDDDIVPNAALLESHIAAHAKSQGDLVAGRVLQPWHHDEHDLESFTSAVGEFKQEFMGGNFSISRDLLMNLGGFDENFKGAAYRYEREFADRLLEHGRAIWYEPSALIRHLHHSSGGTRSKGDHLTSWNPRHPVGAYYYLLISPRVKWRPFKALQRLFRAVATRHHLKKPWYIPVTLVSEVSGMAWALWLRSKGPALSFAGDGHRRRKA
jgi:GT2 family glycosyltransferase